tara:strand:+ start:34 stop:369 length:336 start_codon:yes stop_codon:yes gene_type:complete
MKEQENSYTDWKNHTEHLSKAQFDLAGTLLLRGEGPINSINIAEKLVLPVDRKSYLRSKPRIYQIGWLNCERDQLTKDKIDVSFKDELLFEQGYNDCKENLNALKSLEEVA